MEIGLKHAGKPKRSILCDQDGSQEADIFSNNPKDLLVYHKIKQQSSHFGAGRYFPFRKPRVPTR